MRLIYEIKAEKERKRSNHKDELGVRIQDKAALFTYLNKPSQIPLFRGILKISI